MIACGRNRDVFLAIGPASSRTERPAGTPAAIHDPNTRVVAVEHRERRRRLHDFDGVQLAGTDLLRKVPGGEALQAIGTGWPPKRRGLDPLWRIRMPVTGRSIHLV
jgi:hypothetical protein